MVGAISRRFLAVFGTPGGVGLPSSMYSEPPLVSTILKLWLLPKVWLHGNQSTTTGGSSVTKAKPDPSIAWFEQSMRWVLMTPLGLPVEPEVNRNLAIVSADTARFAAATPASSVAPSRSANIVVLRSPSGLRVTTNSTSSGTV